MIKDHGQRDLTNEDKASLGAFWDRERNKYPFACCVSYNTCEVAWLMPGTVLTLYVLDFSERR